MTTLLNDLATEAREINAANGWGLTFTPDELPSYLALIHSEITEAWGADTDEAAVRELGDVIVRALDLGELLEPGCWRDRSHLLSELGGSELRADTWPTMLLALHGLTSDTLEHYRKVVDWHFPVMHTLHLLVAGTWQVMCLTYHPSGLTPEPIIREILAANRARAFRHGGRRL